MAWSYSLPIPKPTNAIKVRLITSGIAELQAMTTFWNSVLECFWPKSCFLPQCLPSWMTEPDRHPKVLAMGHIWRQPSTYQEASPLSCAQMSNNAGLAHLLSLDGPSKGKCRCWHYSIELTLHRRLEGTDLHYYCKRLACQAQKGSCWFILTASQLWCSIDWPWLYLQVRFESYSSAGLLLPWLNSNSQLIALVGSSKDWRQAVPLLLNSWRFRRWNSSGRWFVWVGGWG